MSRQYAVTLQFPDESRLTVGTTANTRRTAERRAFVATTQDCKDKGLALPKRVITVEPCSTADLARLCKEAADYFAKANPTASA